MKRKVPKSLQAIIITLLVGMLLPKLVSLTGAPLVDKVLWKIVFTLSFNLATIIVGVLYATNLIHGKVEGGKARITIYFVIIIIFLCTASSVLVFFKEVAKWVLIVIGVVALIFILALIFNYIFSIKDKKNKFKTSQAKSVEIKNLKEKTIQPLQKQIANTVKDIKTLRQGQQIPVVVTGPQESILTADTIEAIQPKLKTIHELWEEKDILEKCLTVTNKVHPDLRWVKIYKPPYGNGKFYGYVMMMNARNTVSGEIYFADEPIWMLYNG